MKYSNDPAADKQATLVQNAIDSKVDAICDDVADAGCDDGCDEGGDGCEDSLVGVQCRYRCRCEILGALMYFGSDETIAGEAVGKRLADLGAKHPVCVIQEAGQVQLEARCAGVATECCGDGESCR